MLGGYGIEIMDHESMSNYAMIARTPNIMENIAKFLPRRENFALTSKLCYEAVCNVEKSDVKLVLKVITV